MPGPELVEAADQRDLVLGGCCITPTLACDSPDLTCTTCNWTGFELNGELFEENDLAGVMNAHAQQGSELFLQGTGLSFSSATQPEMKPRPGGPKCSQR